MLHDQVHDQMEEARTRMIDRALLVAASISFGFGLTVMMAGLFR